MGSLVRTQPFLQQLELTLVPVDHNVVEDGMDKMVGDQLEVGLKKLPICVHWNAAWQLAGEGGTK